MWKLPTSHVPPCTLFTPFDSGNFSLDTKAKSLLTLSIILVLSYLAAVLGIIWVIVVLYASI